MFMEYEIVIWGKQDYENDSDVYKKMLILQGIFLEF